MTRCSAADAKVPRGCDDAPAPIDSWCREATCSPHAFKAGSGQVARRKGARASVARKGKRRTQAASPPRPARLARQPTGAPMRGTVPPRRRLRWSDVREQSPAKFASPRPSDAPRGPCRLGEKTTAAAMPRVHRVPDNPRRKHRSTSTIDSCADRKGRSGRRTLEPGLSPTAHGRSPRIGNPKISRFDSLIRSVEPCIEPLGFGT